MKRLTLAALAVVMLAGCAPRTLPDYYSQLVIDIYSTQSVAIAQDKADKYCGAHAYFLDSNYRADMQSRKDNPNRGAFTPGIPFSCDLSYAARNNQSTEAVAVAKKQYETGMIEYYKAQYRLKEVRRKNADPNKLETYTETEPDGTIHSYSILNGKICESRVSSTSGESKCE